VLKPAFGKVKRKEGKGAEDPEGKTPKFKKSYRPGRGKKEELLEKVSSGGLVRSFVLGNGWEQKNSPAAAPHSEEKEDLFVFLSGRGGRNRGGQNSLV